MNKQKFTIEFDEHPGGLWARINGKRYLICQTSGEFVADNGCAISDFYWEDPSKNPEIVKDIFQAIANKFGA